MNKFKCSMQKKKESLADNVNLGFKVGDFKGTQKSVILKIKKALDNKGIANEVVADGRCLEVTLDNANVIIQTVAEGGYGSHKSSSYVVLGKDSDNYRNQTDAYSIKDVMDYIQDANGRKSEATYNSDESKKSEANIDDLKGMVVSDGTMRSEDLIPKFLNVLKTYGRDKYDAYVKENPEVLDLKGMDDETMGYVVDELFDKLDEIAPEGFYFAAHPDDGACYGFWEVDPNESKKPEACKGGKDDDKKGGKDGKAAKSKKNESDGSSWALDYLEETAQEKGLKVDWNGPTEIVITVGTPPYTDRIYVTDDAPGEDDTSLELYVPVAHINTSGLTLQDVLDYLDDPIGKRDAVQFKNGNRSNKVESKKSEGVSGTITMNIDYNTFMRLLDAAAFLDADEDYKDALWDYYSELGEIGGEALVFFDNLFQYTAWYDVDEMYDNIGERFQDESKSKEECIQDAIDDGDMTIYQYKDHYLVLN